MHEIQYLPLADLIGARSNPKQHSPQIGPLINRFGYAAPVLRDDRTGRLVAGHGRVEALRVAYHNGQAPPSGILTAPDGAWLVPVVCGWASRSDEDAAAYLIADNRSSENGGWDHKELAALLDEIGDPELVDLTGWDLGELAELLDPGDDTETMPDAGDADTGPSATVWGVTVTCRDEREQVGLLDRLTSEGYTVRALM